jgi:hypothetical protein
LCYSGYTKPGGEAGIFYCTEVYGPYPREFHVEKDLQFKLKITVNTKVYIMILDLNTIKILYNAGTFPLKHRLT